MWRATVLTLFPEIFPGPLGCSLAGEALTRGVWSLETKQIRDHGLGRHHTVDDAPMGGGPGMVMRVDVLAAALNSLSTPDDARPRLLMSPRGRPLTQARVRDLAQASGVIIICPRFEGVDERIIAARQLERNLLWRLYSFRRRNSGAYVDGCMCAFIAWRYGRDGVWRRGKF